MTTVTERTTPLRTWRVVDDFYSNGKPSGRMRLVGDWNGGETIELATILSRAGDVNTEDVAAILTEALDALRAKRGIR